MYNGFADDALEGALRTNWSIFFPLEKAFDLREDEAVDSEGQPINLLYFTHAARHPVKYKDIGKQDTNCPNSSRIQTDKHSRIFCKL